jgi:HEAT repeat protein
MPVRNIERELEALVELRGSEAGEARSRSLRKALGDKVNVIVAKAAALTAEMQVRALIPDLCGAFERLLIDPLKTDPKCWGKEAIAKALKDLGHAESAIFLKGVQHVQLELVWGGEEDTATTVRGTCALALLGCTDLTREDKLWHVMRLLTEASPSLRKDGALALESLEGREAALLLRIKARMGDRDTTVTGQVFESLLRVEGEAAVPFVAEFLRATTEEVREEAALALGASRLAGAVASLKDALAQKHLLVDYEIVLRALSISRHEEAVRFLLEVVRSRRPGEAIAALEALKLYRDSSEIREKVTEVVARRSESEIQREFQRLFQKE